MHREEAARGMNIVCAHLVLDVFHRVFQQCRLIRDDARRFRDDFVGHLVGEQR